jgi:ribosomal protein L11 methyltransferase
MDGRRPESGADPSPWNQVTIRIAPEAEEGLANLLFELGSTGLVTHEEEPPGPLLTAYFPSHHDLPSTLKAIAHYLDSLAQIGIDPRASTIQSLPWQDMGEADGWRQYFKPLLLGRRWVIKPSWDDYEPDPSEIVIEIDPGRAFGTGRHPSTGICLRFLERWMRGGEEVLDLGTGSGILAIAAAKLGAGRVTALDVDPDSVQIARENARLNMAEQRIRICQGSLPLVPDQDFDLCVANLSLKEIRPLLPSLRCHLRSEKGILFVSGILRAEVDILRALLDHSHWRWVELEFQGEWAGLGFRRRD